MADVLVVVGVVAFFAVTLAYLRACESLVERSSLPADAGLDAAADAATAAAPTGEAAA